MNRILITGATGNIGGQVLSQLAATGLKVSALVRNPDAARLPRHVEVVRGDLTLPETLDSCLDAIDTVFLVWVAPAEAVAPAWERIAKRARRIVFLSAPLALAVIGLVLAVLYRKLQLPKGVLLVIMSLFHPTLRTLKWEKIIAMIRIEGIPALAARLAECSPHHSHRTHPALSVCTRRLTDAKFLCSMNTEGRRCPSSPLS